MNRALFLFFIIFISCFCFSQKIQEAYKGNLKGNVKEVKITQFVVGNNGTQKIKKINPSSGSTCSSTILYPLLEFKNSFPIIKQEFDSLGRIIYAKECNSKGEVKISHQFIYDTGGYLTQKVIADNTGKTIGGVKYPVTEDASEFIVKYKNGDSLVVYFSGVSAFSDSFRELLEKDSLILDTIFVSPNMKDTKYHYKIIKNKKNKSSTFSEYRSNGDLISEYVTQEDENFVKTNVFLKEYKWAEEDGILTIIESSEGKSRRMSYTQIKDKCGNWIETDLYDDKRLKEIVKREITYYE